jgi:pimeloyl-ACP methyl ester carboxylesterase
VHATHLEPPAEQGVHDGLAYALFAPARDAVGGVVILHGAGSQKDNHFDFARACTAAGLAAVVFDQRGHGASSGALDARALDDVATMAALLPEGPVALRGSSMGGWVALAAAATAGATAVVAICPASGEQLRGGLRERRWSVPVDKGALDRLFASVDLVAAASALGAGLLLQHAEGDETVPVEHSRALHAAARGSTLDVAPGGDHRSVQHDAERQARAVAFIAARCEAVAA